MRPQDLAALPPARLARDGETIVCRTPGCGVRFATCDNRVLEAAFPGRDFEEHREEAEAFAALLIGQRMRFRRWPAPPSVVSLIVLAGWVEREDRVWSMSARAWRRLSQGRRPVYRRLPPEFRSLPRRKQRRYHPWGVDIACPGDLPLAFRCPACRVLQRLDAETVMATGTARRLLRAYERALSERRARLGETQGPAPQSR